MTKLTNEQIERILEGAPDGATHVGQYWDDILYFKFIAESGIFIIFCSYESKWSHKIQIDPIKKCRDLSDLRTILVQHGELERLCNPWVKFADAHPTVPGEYLLSRPTKWTTYNVVGFDGEYFDARIEFIGEWLLLPPKGQSK